MIKPPTWDDKIMRVFASCCDSRFFEAQLLQIWSIHSIDVDAVDAIRVYNLGLSPREIDFLNGLHKVEVVEFPDWVRGIFDGYLEPGQFAWKPFVIKDAARFGNLVFYLDAGAMLLRSADRVYEIIERDDVLIVGDSHRNDRWTTEACFQALGATPAERDGLQICAGIQGYRANGRFQRYVDDAFEYSKIREAVFGDRACHRHDQSIYSILAHRYGLPRQDIEIFGGWRGVRSEDQVIVVHRTPKLPPAMAMTLMRSTPGGVVSEKIAIAAIPR